MSPDKFNQLYRKSVASKEPQTPEVTEPTAPEAKAAIQHQQWLLHPQTIEFLEALELESWRQLAIATQLACSGADEKSKDKALIRSDNINKVIEYARRNTRIEKQ